MPVAIVPSTGPCRRAGKPVPAGEAHPYGPERTVRRCFFLEEESVPFATSDQAREGIPRAIIGNIQGELLAVERRSHALEGQLTETVEFLQAREEWWRQGLLEVMEAAGAERHHFEQLEQTAETEFHACVNVLEDSVNRSRLQTEESQQNVRQHEQHLSTLEDYAQQLRQDRTDLAIRAQSVVDALNDELNQSISEEASIAHAFNEGKMLESEQPQLMNALRSELASYELDSMTKDTRILQVSAENDRIKAETAHMMAAESSQNARALELEGRLAETQARVCFGSQEYRKILTEKACMELQERERVASMKNELDELHAKYEVQLHQEFDDFHAEHEGHFRHELGELREEHDVQLRQAQLENSLAEQALIKLTSEHEHALSELEEWDTQY